MLLGYSRFSPTEYISGNLAFRFSFDPPGTLRGDQVAKAGESSYDVDNGGGGFRWGDFSHTVPDPTDDLSLWTIQQYAASPAGHWAVWWKRISIAAPVALFIVGSDVPNAAELAVKTRLEGLGYQVVVKSAVTSASSDATGKAIVLISSAVTSSQVNTKFRTVPVPVLCWESALLDDLGMTGATAGRDFGIAGLQTSITITFPGHPLAAGLSGTLAVVSAPSTFSWGAPNGNAILVGRPAGSTDRAAIFAYDAGTEMPGLVAPARRIGFFLEDNTASTLTPNGWKLFDAAVRWATSPAARPALLVTALTPLGPGDVAVRSRLQLLGYPVVIRTDAASAGSDAGGKSFIVLSSTVESSRVNTKFTGTPVGILNWENRLLDDLNMTGSIPGTDMGTAPNQTSIQIRRPGHPLAAGLSGTVSVVTAPSTMSWGRAPSDATVIATLPEDPNRAVLFAYLPTPPGSARAIAGRRVHFFLEDATSLNLNANGWALFDAAVSWVSAPVAVAKSSVSSASLATTASADTASGCGTTGLEFLILLAAFRGRRRSS
jgi:hypothetical protein